MGWLEYILAAVTFLATHSIPLRPAVRKPLEARIGRNPFLILYSALSVAVLAWLIIAAGRAPFIEVWPWDPWQLLAPQIGMALVCLILALSLGKPNPFSFGGAHNADFDPTNPGIIGWTRHPLLIAMAVWAAAHVVPNGDLAHVAMFGAFTLFSLMGIVMIDRRHKRTMGSDWARLKAQTVAWPMPQISTDFITRIALAALTYGLLVWAHPLLFGVYPFG